MSLHGWIRVKLFGPPDQIKHEVAQKIESEVSRLNGATQQLTQEVQAIRINKEENRKERQNISRILDDTLAAMQKEFRR